MREHVLLLDLADDPALIAEYEAYHAPDGVWPEVIASIHRSGIRSMRIYRLDNRLVMVMSVDDDFSFATKAAADAADPVVQRWETLMSRFQQTIPGGSDEAKWREANRIFVTSPSATLA